MTIKTIKFKNKGKLITNETEREVKGLIIMTALFAASLIIGAGTVKIDSTFLLIQDFADIFISNRASQKIYEIFINCLIVNLFCIGTIVFSGFNCIGIPVSVAVSVLKGLGIGLITGYLFAENGMSGFGYYLMTILPGEIISNTALIIIANDSIFMSSNILLITLEKGNPDKSVIKNYIKKVIYILIFSVIASIIESITVRSFSTLFLI